MSSIIVNTELQQCITSEQAWRYKIVPKHNSENLIEFFIAELNYNENIHSELELILNKKVKFKFTSAENVDKALATIYRNQNVSSEKSNINEDFLKKIIFEAYSLKSSDIHFESFKNKCRIRFRIDGQLIERYVLKKDEYPQIINKIKIAANLDIAEKRLPQDGRILFEYLNNNIDIRISILPTLFGEKAVLRILTKDTNLVDINNLGLTDKQLTDFLIATKRPNGIVLISGPTGSGKTTTLYATLKLLNLEKTNILTIEDPIEYTLDGINQVQLKEDIGLTFASALRTFLRQDPDIIMVGEIRDSETAQMAIRAALTGHLVLSTIHTNSAWGSISRLIDMGVPSYLLANTINLTAAQRLIRELCPFCKTEVRFVPENLSKLSNLQKELDFHFTPTGCEKCYYTGYKGRRAIYEILPIDQCFSEYIKLNKALPYEELRKKNISLLYDSAIELVRKGITSLDEVLPIIFK